MNTFDISDIVLERQINFYLRMYNHQTMFIKDFMRNVFLSQSSYAVSNVYKFVNRFDIPFNDILHLNKNGIKRIISLKYQNVDWKISIIKEVLSCLDGHTEIDLNKEEMLYILNCVCTSR